MNCIGPSPILQKLNQRLQNHVDQHQLLDQHQSLTLALFGNDNTIASVLQTATRLFPMHQRITSFNDPGSLKASVAQFATRFEDTLSDPTGTDTEYKTPLIILDNFATANPTVVSALHQAWERERPSLRHQEVTYDLSRYIWLVVFRGEDLAASIRSTGSNDWREPLLGHWSSLVANSNQEELTPAAAVGRISGGYVLNAVPHDFVVPEGCQVSREENKSSSPLADNAFVLLPLLVLFLWYCFVKQDGSGEKKRKPKKKTSPTKNTKKKTTKKNKAATTASATATVVKRANKRGK